MRMVSGYAHKVIRKGTQYNRPPEADIIYQFVTRALGLKIALGYLVNGKIRKNHPDAIFSEHGTLKDDIVVVRRIGRKRGDTEEA